MKIVLLPKTGGKKGCANKDTCGGFGSHTWVGSSLPARMLEWAKKRSVSFPIHSLGYLSAIFRNAGHEVEVPDGTPPRSADLILAPASIIDYKAEIENARKAAKETGAPLGFFGTFPSVKPELFLPHARFVIRGEPESAACKIAGVEIPNGLVESPPIQNLDSLPFPDWRPFPHEKFDYAPTLPLRPFMPILSSRGCPMPCKAYCPFPIVQGPKWRSRSPENVIEEIAALHRDYGARSVMFRDPFFALDKPRAHAIAEGILKLNIDLRFGIETILSQLDMDLIELMHKAGLRSIETGVESSDSGTHERLGRKKERQEEIAEKISRVERLGVKVSAFYIIGLPGETREQIETTLAFARRVNSFGAQFSIFTPYPGAPSFDEIFAGAEPPDWENFDQYTPVAPNPLLSTETLLRLKESAFVRYYFRPSWMAKFLSTRLRRECA